VFTGGKNGSFDTGCCFPDPFLFVKLKQKNCMDAQFQITGATVT